MKKQELKHSDFQNKRAYKKPKLKRIGKVSDITLKTGSQSDFGSNFFQA